MQMLPSISRRAPLLGIALLIVLATSLAGCASKNPLMDDAKPSTAVKPIAATSALAVSPIPATQSVATETKPVLTTTPPVQNTPAPTGAKRFLGIFTPYKLDIQQGNFISHEMLSKLKEGMTKEQVRFLLGVPLLTDIFHDGRWDYLFRLQKANGELTTNRVTVFFKDSRVTRFESTNLPSEVEYISNITGSPAKPKQDKTETSTK